MSAVGLLARLHAAGVTVRPIGDGKLSLLPTPPPELPAEARQHKPESLALMAGERPAVPPSVLPEPADAPLALAEWEIATRRLDQALESANSLSAACPPLFDHPSAEKAAVPHESVEAAEQLARLCAEAGDCYAHELLAKAQANPAYRHLDPVRAPEYFRARALADVRIVELQEPMRSPRFTAPARWWSEGRTGWCTECCAISTRRADPCQPLALMPPGDRFASSARRPLRTSQRCRWSGPR
jgi:hypothetical protein